MTEESKLRLERIKRERAKGMLPSLADIDFLLELIADGQELKHGEG